MACLVMGVFVGIMGVGPINRCDIALGQITASDGRKFVYWWSGSAPFIAVILIPAKLRPPRGGGWCCDGVCLPCSLP